MVAEALRNPWIIEALSWKAELPEDHVRAALDELLAPEAPPAREQLAGALIDAHVKATGYRLFTNQAFRLADAILAVFREPSAAEPGP